MPVPIMLYLIRQLCDALEYAHHLRDEHGELLRLVHRDISPSNLLVAEDGNLKIIDFGIAKAAPTSLRTQSGRLKGKFSYMAPEVIHGHSFEHRSDLFAVGVVAYELLTARPLFAAKNEYDTLRRITKKSVAAPSMRNPKCPPELDRVVLRALEKSPAKRWRSAGDMLGALDQVAKKLSLQATNRDVAEWMNWAFEQPLQSRRISQRLVGPGEAATVQTSALPESHAATEPVPAPVVKKAPADEPEPLAPPPGPAPALPRLSGLELANIDMVWSENRDSGEDGHLSKELTTRITNAFASEDALTATIVQDEASHAPGTQRRAAVEEDATRAEAESPEAASPPGSDERPTAESPPGASSQQVHDQDPALAKNLHSSGEAGDSADNHVPHTMVEVTDKLPRTKPAPGSKSASDAMITAPVAHAQRVADASWSTSLLGWLLGLLIVAAIGALVYFLM